MQDNPGKNRGNIQKIRTLYDNAGQKLKSRTMQDRDHHELWKYNIEVFTRILSLTSSPPPADFAQPPHRLYPLADFSPPISSTVYCHPPPSRILLALHAKFMYQYLSNPDVTTLYPMYFISRLWLTAKGKIYNITAKVHLSSIVLVTACSQFWYGNQRIGKYKYEF